MAWVGEMFNAGLAEGLADTGQVESALDNVNDMLLDSVNPDLALSGDLTASGAQTGTIATLGSILQVVSSLSAQIRDMKIYLDGKAVVGGIISGTDDALGRRDVVASRGGALT